MYSKIGIGNLNKKSYIPQHSKSEIYAVRVTKVILDEKTYPDLFSKMGEWDSIGIVFYDDINNPNPNFIESNFAYPLFPNIKNYPLKNEIIYLINLPSSDIYDNTGLSKSYYFTPLNVWNNINHNAIPENITGKELESKFLGNYFEEKEGIRSLKPYEGDILYEGRWGNSIRFSSTQPKTNNFWSSLDENQGDPILLLRNGQPDNPKGENWVYISENINKDKSNIYLTSSQKIPIKISSKNYESYKESPPEGSDSYKRPQIILSSYRILINSKDDHILLSSNKSINLNSLTTINLDSKNPTIINSPEIYLGGKEAEEPIVLGNKGVELLEKILDEIISVSDELGRLISLPPGTPFVTLNVASTMANVRLNQYKNQLKTILSKRNYST